MAIENEPAFDAFVDDCLLNNDQLCKYSDDLQDLDLFSSKIIQGV